ncbi:hypothetical protein E4U38_000882 [Claviceps purpurea]|nr:hypothetical protein E4U38_000882 [Claviceps purpurea]KAG6238480.1 hypothetical protein E4U25_001671 [Claviceps purpurea]
MVENTQQTAGSGQMAPQQPQRPPTEVPLHRIIYQTIINDSQTTPSTMAWQLDTNANERMGLTMDLISNIALAVHDIGHVRAAELGCNFEQEMFHKSPSKEVYHQAMANKILDFYKKKQENESRIESAGGTPSANSTS